MYTQKNKKSNATKDFNRQGLSAQELIESKQAEYAEAGIELTEEEAFEEVIADALEGIMADGRVLELLQAAEAKDKRLGAKVRQFFQDIGRMIRDTIRSYQDVAPESAEGRLIRQLEDIYSQLQEAFAEGVYDAGTNFHLAGDDVANEGNLRYSKHAKVFFKENVFPPFNESHSEAHELAERWSRSDSAKVQNMRLISFHNKWYLIQAFDDLKYGYQIIRKLTVAEYKRESKYYDTITGYKSLQDSLNEDVAQHSGRSADRETGYRSDHDALEHGRENSEFHELGENQVRRDNIERNSGRNSGSSVKDTRRTNGSSVTTDSDGNQQSTNRNPRESPDIRYSIGRKTDKAAQEMASAYPDVFDAQINAGDMPVALGEIIDRLRNENTSALEYAHSRRWIEQDLIRDVYDSYWRVNNLRTVADRNAVQINRLKSKPKSTSCSCRGLSPGRACKMKENRL